MKDKFDVTVCAEYSKKVSVFVEDGKNVLDAVDDMVEWGDLKWGDDDFVKWEITDEKKVEHSEEERKAVHDWAANMVISAATVDPEWVYDEMCEPDCLTWFKALENRGAIIPEAACDYDL